MGTSLLSAVSSVASVDSLDSVDSLASAPSPRMLAEWSSHALVWLAFPHMADEWAGHIDAARCRIADFANAIADSGRGEAVRLLVRDSANADLAAKLVDSAVHIEIAAFGDIWLRDTGAVIIGSGAQRIAAIFDFNGWGGKFNLPDDKAVAPYLAQASRLPTRRYGWVFEGGALDVDGAGLGVTTESCLLHRNRNPQLTKADIEQRLAEIFGLEQILWLGAGLAGDHTDGHVDNLARFVDAGLLAIPRASTADDPNAMAYSDAHKRARDFGLATVDMPSAGAVYIDGALAPASYMNFYIGNRTVVVPAFGTANDQAAVATLAGLFPDRKVLSLSARGLLAGGGAFHCASQQFPL